METAETEGSSAAPRYRLEPAAALLLAEIGVFYEPTGAGSGGEEKKKKKKKKGSEKKQKQHQ